MTNEILDELERLLRNRDDLASVYHEQYSDLSSFRSDAALAAYRKNAAAADLDRALDKALPELLAAAREAGALRETLEWYAEQVRGCRIIGGHGDEFRHALDRDGGQRARAALGETK